MEIINKDSKGFYAEVNYQEALLLVYLGLLAHTMLENWDGCRGDYAVSTVYVKGPIEENQKRIYDALEARKRSDELFQR